MLLFNVKEILRCVLACGRVRVLSVVRRMILQNWSVDCWLCGVTTMCQLVRLWRPSCDAGQEIERLLWNPTVHYRVHNSTPLVPVLSQFSMSLSSMLTLFFRIHLNLPSVLFPSVLPTRNLIALLLTVLQAKYCKYLSLKNRINLNRI